MAKKSLASLMVGIMGENNTEVEPAAPKQVVAATPEPTSEPKPEPKPEPEPESEPEKMMVKDEPMVPYGNPAPARRRAGRPRKGETPVKSDEIRATFIVDPGQIKKLKYISLAEGMLLKEAVFAALEAYIAEWESENGEIRIKTRSKSKR